ncbi:MmgE/PrpD family protein [Rhodococcus opacus]|nr:MmgE/PrpD family protein [Rhodococcus opacus]
MDTRKNHQPDGAELDPPHGVVGRIASYIDAVRGTHASEPARQAAFRAVLDLLGAAAAGIGDPGPTAVRNTVRNTMAAGSVPIWFSGASSSVIGAAWANSAAASALDLDDGHRMARGHPGAAVIPTAFAIATETNAALEDIISAIVIGYEVGVTIGAARTTYGNTGTWSSYAVVATAAALRGTSHDVMAHALAIAGESAPNQLFLSAPAPRIPDPEGSAVKEGIPWSVVTGLVALELAEAGHTGPRNILDSVRHYSFPDELTLEASQHICNTYFKLYACCRHVHAPLDALLQILEQHDITAGDIDAIEVETTSGALRITNKVCPTNLIDVQYSIPYCLALAATAGAQALLPLTDEALRQDGVTALARKVKLSLNPAFDARFPAETLARVTIIVGDQRLTSEVVTPRGEATNPLSWAELEAKFEAATRMVATEAQQRLVLGAMDDARAGNLTALTASLAEVTLRPGPTVVNARPERRVHVR